MEKFASSSFNCDPDEPGSILCPEKYLSSSSVYRDTTSHSPVSGCAMSAKSRKKRHLTIRHALHVTFKFFKSLACYKRKTHPEITCCVGELLHGQGLLMLNTSQPMPKAEDVESKFIEVLEELDLTAANRAAMLRLPLEKKWLLYCSRKCKDDTDNINGHSYMTRLPEFYIDKIHALAGQPYSNNTEEISKRLKLMDSLQTALRTQPNSFVLKFIERQGLEACHYFITQMDTATCESNIHGSLIRCLKALMNNTNGRMHVLAHPHGLNVISQSLVCRNIRTKVAVLEILGAVCLVPGGHRKVLETMLYYQDFANERARFQTVVEDLSRSAGNYTEDVQLKTALMSFINAVLSCGLGQDSVEFRLHLRYEFLQLNIMPIIDGLFDLQNETLHRHLDFFNEMRIRDENELAKRYTDVTIDTSSAYEMFDHMNRHLQPTLAYVHFKSMLYHCLMMPFKCQHWMLIDLISQQVVINANNSDGMDLTALNINIQAALNQLSDAKELMEKQNQLKEMEEQCNALKMQVNEGKSHANNLQQEICDLNNQILNLNRRTVSSVSDISNCRSTMNGETTNTNSLSDEDKLNNLSSTTEKIFRSESISIAPSIMAPIIAPPILNATKLQPANKQIKKNTPKSTSPLKSFNWSKLPYNKIADTVWSKMKEESLYRYLDLAEIDNIFSAYSQKNNGIYDGSVEDLSNGSRTKSKVISLIDARRAQNCTIILSKVRLSHNEIKRAIMSMDSKDELDPDMIEQMMKFTPSVEEVSLLNEHVQDLQYFAKADRFLFEISRINRYEARLKSLYYKKKFIERMNDAKTKISSVNLASKEIRSSVRLCKFLELVLAFGNYMNRGQRGNAFGFRLESLRRIGDTKSSVRRNTTLLSYIVDVIETKFCDLLRLADDLVHVPLAAKVNLVDLRNELACLRVGLKDISDELVNFKTQKTSKDDLFEACMNEFLRKSSPKYQQIEKEFQKMQSEFELTIAYFGENFTQTDEFFGIFDNMLTLLETTLDENRAFRKKVVEEQKRLVHEKEIKLASLQRRRNGSCVGRHNSSMTGVDKHLEAGGGEFDDLISALRTGEVFSDNFRCTRRRRRAAVLNSLSVQSLFCESRERPIHVR